MIITMKQIIHLKSFWTIIIMFIFISFAFSPIFESRKYAFCWTTLVALTHNITKISFIVPVYNFYVIYVIQLLYVCTYCSLTGYVFTTIFRQSLFLLYQETSRIVLFWVNKTNKPLKNVALTHKILY